MKTEKYRNIGIVMVLWMFVLLVGCKDPQSFRDFEEADKISVVTTIYPMYDFVKKIGGDYVEVYNLVPAGMEPHDFELSTGDMRLLEQADLFIYNGADMEHFVDKTLQALSNSKLVIVEAAKDIPALVAEDGDVDPHTWLSIENAMQEAQQIKDALVQMDAQHAAFYKENYELLQAEFLCLKEEYEQALSERKNDTIVVAHEAFGYLCDEFGIEQEAVEGLMADSEPDAARMREIIDLCKTEHIHTIFFEELVSPKVAETIAKETGAKTMVLNPIEGLTASQEALGTDYFAIMRENLKALKEALN